MADEAPAALEPGTPAVSVSPAVEQGPASTPGTTPESSSESAAPADFHSEPAVAETPTETPASSILGDAKPDAEPEAAKPAEGEAPKEAAAPEQPAELPLPTYEPFTLPEGIQLDDAKLGTFSGMLGEFERRVASNPAEAHAAAQEFGQKLLDLYIAEAQEAQQRNARLQADNWTRTREAWAQEFRDDPQIGGNRQNTSLARMGALLTLYGQRNGAEREQQLRDAFTLTGAGDHPEVLRFVNWAAGFAVEAPRPVPAVVPKPPTAIGSRAQRLYRTSGAA